MAENDIAPLRAMEQTVADAVEGMSPSGKRKYRIDHGMCPVCGREAAPYYLCWDHRSEESFRRMLNRGAELGVFRKERRGRANYWSLGDKRHDRDAEIAFRRGAYLWDLSADDKRRRPRMGRMPIDLDETLMSIFADKGKPLSVDEIYHAWGQLRSKRKTGTLAGDMAAIIAAKRRREAREAKRARLNQGDI